MFSLTNKLETLCQSEQKNGPGLHNRRGTSRQTNLAPRWESRMVPFKVNVG